MQVQNEVKPCFCPHGSAVNHAHTWEVVETFKAARRYMTHVWTFAVFAAISAFFFAMAIAGIFSSGACGPGVIFALVGLWFFAFLRPTQCCGEAMRRLTTSHIKRCKLCNVAVKEDENKPELRCECCGATVEPNRYFGEDKSFC